MFGWLNVGISELMSETDHGSIDVLDVDVAAANLTALYQALGVRLGSSFFLENEGKKKESHNRNEDEAAVVEEKTSIIF